MTTRKDVEGTLARWFALDADSRIGVFTGAYAAWPAAAFDDYAAVDAADEFLASAPPITEAVLSAAYLASGADPTFPTREACCGFYSFDANLGYGGSTVYFLDALPLRPLLGRDASPTIYRAARLVHFPNLRFSAIEKVDLAGLLPFVVGDG